MLYNTQNNPRWANNKLGTSNATLGQYGCTTTAIANAFVKMPWEICQSSKYTQDGSIIWESVETDVWKFHTRIRQFDRSRIRDVAKDPNRVIILEVKNRFSPTGRHWVTLESLGFGGYNCIDPYNPANKWNALKNFYNILQVLGHAEFIKK